MDQCDHYVNPPRIELDAFFEAICDQPYVLIKGAGLDQIDKGHDLDILCSSIRDVSRILLGVANRYIMQGIEVEIRELRRHRHIQMDLTWRGELLVRFDLYGRLPVYPSIRFKRNYFERLIQDRREEFRTWRGGTYPLYRPSLMDELVLRYVEYVQYFPVRPDKIKHLEYLLGYLKHQPEYQRFLDRLHQYIDVPLPQANEDGELIVKRYTLCDYLQAIRSELLHMYRQIRKKLSYYANRLKNDPVGVAQNKLRRVIGEEALQSISKAFRRAA